MTKPIHNAAYDAVRLSHHFRIYASPIHDTMLAARRRGEKRYSLRAQAQPHIGGQKGRHYVFPVQGKSGSEKLSIVQIKQDVALCASKFPALICRPIGPQFMDDKGGLIALFEFESTSEGLRIAEKSIIAL